MKSIRQFFAARGERHRRLPAGVAAGIGALVVAAGLAASAQAANASTVTYFWLHTSPQNQLIFGGTIAGTTINSGPIDSIEPGTSPASTPVGNPLAPSGADFAYVNGSGDLIVVKAYISSTDLGPAAPGHSPAIITLTNGNWLVAYVAPGGYVEVAEPGFSWNLTYGQAAPGTSPALAALPNGQWELGYHSTDGNLVTEGADNHGEWNLGLWPGTSPAMSGLANGSYEVAFEAAGTANLWTVGPTDFHGDWRLGMRAGTSPAIVGTPNGSYEVAFQANTGSLWTVGSDDHDDWGLGMRAGTSPAITLIGGGSNYEVAFQANTGSLWTVGADNHGDWGSPTEAGTSPTITPW